MGIGTRIKTIRIAQGITLTKLSKISKVSKAYISQLENEDFSNPSSEVVIKLSNALDISVEQILGLENFRPKFENYAEVSPHLRNLAKEECLCNDDIEMLSKISYKGKQPTSIEGWRTVLKAIQESVEIK